MKPGSDVKRTERGSKSKTLILCDFDGTVSTKDTVNRLVRDHIVSEEWRFHVKRYMRGEIGSREVYEAVAPMMRMTVADLERFVTHHAELDPYFPQFLQWAGQRGVDVKIVSDGFDATIRSLFSRHDVNHLEIFANELELAPSGKVCINSPHANPACGRCGTCKVSIVKRFRESYDRIVLIGDGESDRHAAKEADAVLALRDLFSYCTRSGIPAVRVEGFAEVPHVLTRRTKAIAFDMDGTLVDSLESITEAFNHMFDRLGYPHMTVDQVARKTSVSLIDFVKSFLAPDEGELGIKIFRDYYDTIFLKKTLMMPGSVDALRSLNGAIPGVVTNKRGRYARLLAEHLGFASNMAMIIGAEDGYKAKPSGEMLEEFVRAVGASPETTVYVGDAPIDVQSAHNAGVDAYAIAGPIFSAEELALYRPRRVLTNISELPASLAPIIP